MSGMDALRGASKQRDEFRRQDERVRQLKSQYDKGFKAGCDAQREEDASIAETYAQDNETIFPSFTGIAKAIRANKGGVNGNNI